MKSAVLRNFLFAGLFTILAINLNAQNANEKYDLLLKFGQVNIIENVDHFINNFDPSAEETFNGYYYKIIQFYNIPTNDKKNQLLIVFLFFYCEET